MKFAFIRAEKAHFPITVMCRLLGVTRSGYYLYLKRKPSKRSRDEQLLCEHVRAIFIASRETYGSPRVYEELLSKGIRVSKTRVERAMRGMGLTPKPRRRHVITTNANPAHSPAPNHLARRSRAGPIAPSSSTSSRGRSSAGPSTPPSQRAFP